jgi:hypothetical protein
MQDPNYQIETRDQLRQKMINLMYILFIVLTVLYLPINFNYLSKYFSRSYTEYYVQQNRDIHLFKRLIEKEIAAAPKADMLKDMSAYRMLEAKIAEVDTLLHTLRNTLVDAAGGYTQSGYVKDLNNIYLPKKLIISTSASDNLHNHLSDIKNYLSGLENKKYYSTFDGLVNTDTLIIKPKGKTTEWNLFYFSKVPTSFTISLLDKLKNDITLLKYMIIRDMFDLYVLKEDRKLYVTDTVYSDARILKVSNPSEPGDKYLALNSPENPEGEKEPDTIRLEKKKPEPVKKKEEIFFSENVVKITKEKNKYAAIYKGIYNPVQADFDRYGKDRVRLKCDNGILKWYKDRLYILPVKEGYCKVTATVNDRIVGEDYFNVVRLPDPGVSIADVPPGEISSKTLKAQNKISLGYDNNQELDGNDLHDVMGFNIARVNAYESQRAANSGSENFSPEVKKIVRDAKEGDYIIIEDIKISMGDGSVRTLEPVVYKVK